MEMDNFQAAAPPESQPGIPQLPPPADEASDMSPENKRAMVIVGIVVLFFVVLIGLSIYYLGFVAAPGQVTRIRDIFIIWMAFLSLFTGLALVILLVQVTRLINLLQNEIKPILDSTNETVSTLRGTTEFISNNLVEPVIKLNEYLAGFAQLLQVIGVVRKSSKK
jgi:hypothetical protein